MNLHMTLKCDMRQMLAGFPLFQPLDSDRLARVAARARERKLDRNEILFQKGDPAHSLYLVVYGQIKLALPAANGNEKVVELIGPRQCFGEVSLLTESPHPVFAQAVSETLMVQVSRDALDDLLNGDADFARRLLACLARRTRTLIQDVESYTQQSSAQRVIGFLQQHCAGLDGRGDSISLTLPAPKQVIAARLNVSPETLSRVFHDLSEAKLIEVQGKQIIITSVRRLQEYAG